MAKVGLCNKELIQAPVGMLRHTSREKDNEPDKDSAEEIS
jgi:hypothetical protein